MTQEELNRQMIKAVDNRDTKTVRKMLEQGADPNSRDKYGYTALIDACRDGRTDTARLLLEHEADPNVRNNYGETALMYACWYGYIDVINLLIEHDVDINIKNNKGQTALDILKERYPDKYKKWIETSARKKQLEKEDSLSNTEQSIDFNI